VSAEAKVFWFFSSEKNTLPSPELRHRDGIFYTPPVIARHIVAQAIGRWLADWKAEIGLDRPGMLADAKAWDAYRAVFSKIKVVDPACGQGAFLNEVFDYLCREGRAIDRILDTLRGGQATRFEWDTHVLANNIFGVDKDRQAVDAAKRCLWLKTADCREGSGCLNITIRAGNALIKSAAVAGDLAFDWNEAFPEVFQTGGFDVVVGNPPYVDSETMTRAWPAERAYLGRHFRQTRGNWDLYIAFLELGCDLLSASGYLSFITPDKWISKDFGGETRKRILPGLRCLLPVGREVFEGAAVDSLIVVAGAQPAEMLDVMSLDDGRITVRATVAKTGLRAAGGFGALISRHADMLREIEASSPVRLGDIADVENACATSDAYTLGALLSDAGSPQGYQASMHYKVANTGTLGRYVFRWGGTAMRYLGADYMFPVVGRRSFQAGLGAAYRRRAASPKLVVKGLTLLEAALDADGSYVPGKSTLVVPHDDPDTLKFLAAILNSRIASFYVKQKYACASYNGGVNFTRDMLNAIPIPGGIDRRMLIGHVDTALVALHGIGAATGLIHAKVRTSCGAGRMGRKLDSWWSLTRTSFVDEVQKRGVTMAGRQRDGWADVFDEQKASVETNLAELKGAEQAIDGALLAAFGVEAGRKDVLF